MKNFKYKIITNSRKFALKNYFLFILTENENKSHLQLNLAFLELHTINYFSFKDSFKNSKF